MKKPQWTLAMLLALSATAGCSREEPDVQEHADDTLAEHSRVPEDTVFSDQVKALEKAESVQQTLDAAAAKQREEIERQP